MSIGETLAEARRQAGLTVTQVSQKTRIRESIIRAAEKNDFSSCGGDFYARGHIRSIAGVVGADPAPLIREYDEEHGPPGAMSAADVFEPATPIKIRQPRPFPLGRVLLVFLLAAIGFGAYHLVASRSGRQSALPAATVRPTVTPAARAVSSPPAPKASRSPAARPDEAVITLTARQDCWVGITSTSGHQPYNVYNKVVAAGKSVTWREKQRVSLKIGNPPGARLTVNGKSAIPPHSTQPVTLTINPDSATPVSG